MSVMDPSLFSSPLSHGLFHIYCSLERSPNRLHYVSGSFMATHLLRHCVPIYRCIWQILVSLLLNISVIVRVLTWTKLSLELYLEAGFFNLIRSEREREREREREIIY